MIKKKKNIPKPTNFGINLKFLRRLRGVSQGAFAEIVGISRNSIASYENGNVEPNAINFLRICEYFEKDPVAMMVEDIAGQETFSDEPTADDLKKYLHQSFNDFLSQTNEITKVFEGYSEFYAMRKEAQNTENAKELYLILDDLFVLLKSLITENWNLIQGVYPDFAESEVSREEGSST